MARDNCCDFDMKFKEGETKFDLSFGINDGSGVLPAEIEVLGQLENVQLVGEAPDLTGLSFKVIYHKKQIDPGVSPTRYIVGGQQNVTLSYTENGVTIFKQIPVDVQRIPVSLTITGDWENDQHINEHVDTTGLVFTVTYEDGVSQVVTPVVTPSVWTEAGEQEVVFSYTEARVTVTTQATVFVSRLPVEYREVEYLESTGTQYITVSNTAVNVADYRFYYKVAPTYLAGSYSGGYSGIMGANGTPQVGFYYGGWTVGNAGSSLPYPPELFKIYELEYSKNFDASYFVDGLNTGLTRAGTMNLKLFYCESGPASGKARLYYSYAVDRNGDYLYEVIPCRRKSDGVAGLYDLVTDTFLTNSGTGTFVVGGDV